MSASAHPTTAARLRAHGLAWLLALLLPILLLAGVGLARAALAAAAPLDPESLPSLASLGEEGECEVEEPGCEEEDLDFEECAEWEEDEEGGCEETPTEKARDRAEREGEAPAECLLTSATPRVSIAAGQRRLRLDVRYELSGPAEVSVSLRSSGGKGAVAIPARKLRLSHDGSFHDSAELSEEETERALAAKQFTVRMRVLDVPWSCHRYDFRHLVVKRGGSEAPVFSESSADLRAGR